MMNRLCHNTMRLFWLALAALGTATLDPAPARAGFETRNDEIVEFMMESQGADAQFLVRLMSLTQDTTLSFTSFTDIAGNRFSYSSVRGSTYQGLPISITSSGYFDSTDQHWHLGSTITVGGQQWTSTGLGQVIGDPMISIDWDLDKYDYHPRVTVSYERTKAAAYMVSTGTTELTERGLLGDRVTGTTTSRDSYETDGPDKGKWTWSSVVGNARITSTGSSPTDGGSGSFNMGLQVVPAPSGFILLGLGALCMVPRTIGRRGSLPFSRSRHHLFLC